MIIKIDKQFNIVPSHVGLRKYILYYNILFPENNTFNSQYVLMPNACGTLSIAFDGFSIKAELWGATTVPIPLGGEPNNYCVLLLIQLSPYGLYQITRQSQIDFADKRLSLADVDSELYRLLKQAFLKAKNILELVKRCDRILYMRMEKQVVSEALLLAAAAISDRHGQIKVKDVAWQTSYSQRQLNRLFLEQVGMGIKNYARISRFNYVLKNIQKSPSSFAALSQQAGYFDQAHFDKDFKAISGVTPKAYLKTMSFFYYDGMEVCNIISSKEE